MLIVSKFHDYYDRASAFGIDKECVFNRELKEIEIGTNLPSSFERYTHNYRFKLTVSSVLVGFCGVMYPALKLEFASRTDVYPLNSPTPKTEVIYNYDVFIERMTELGITLQPKERWSWHGNYVDNLQGAKKFFEDKHETYGELFRKYHTPIFSIQRSDKTKYRANAILSINAKLNDV